MDRHTKNYGILRDVQSGEIIGLAPNFDNNIALISRGYPQNIERRNDKLIQLFTDFLGKNPYAMKCFESIYHLGIIVTLIIECCNRVPIKADNEFIARFIVNGERQIWSILSQSQ